MGKKKTGATDDLGRLIDEARAMTKEKDALQASLDGLREEIVRRMVKARITEAKGNEAKGQIVTQVHYEWSADHLEGILSDADFDSLCPRIPKKKELRERLRVEPELSAGIVGEKKVEVLFLRSL